MYYYCYHNYHREICEVLGDDEDSDLLGCDPVSLDAWPRRFERPKCLRLKTKSPAVKSTHCNGAARRFSKRYDMGRVFALG